MFDPRAIAVVASALDGVDPNVTLTENGNVVSTPGRGHSDLDLAIEDLLSDRMPAVAVRDVARTALAVAMCASATIGGESLDIDPRAIASELRFLLRTAALEAEQ
ncbi:hypothetical protein M3D00_17185 [Dietzia cinnamea]|uniref:hypothetical protein n=1 Tax=Dietzia cinnamea TaxID=321318 RepID=UPI0021A57298|nr:hypothetical protein [Dietzia cinnamea]MCT2031864.1 hypothetical protein [Dietzia cinnamea]